MPQMIPPPSRPNATYGTITVDPVNGTMVLEIDAGPLLAEGWKIVEPVTVVTEKPRKQKKSEE